MPRPAHKQAMRTPSVESMSEKEREIWEAYLNDLEFHDRVASLRSSGIVQGTWLCVYFARMGMTTAHKIGLAVNADTRIKQLQTSSPVPVTLAAWINVPCRLWLPLVEREAHKQASKIGKALQGEWFDLSEDARRRVINAVVDTIPQQVSGINYEL